MRLEQNCCSDDGYAAFVDTSKIVPFGDLFELDGLHFNEEGSRRLGMSIAPLFLPALLDHRGAWSLPDAGEAGPMPQCFSAPALSEKKVLAYGDSLTAGFYMAGQRFSPYGEALSRELGDVDVWVCGLSGLTAVQLSEDVDARLIVVVACRRGQGLGNLCEGGQTNR